MDRYVVGLEEVDGTQIALVGGKGAQLGELSRIGGIRVPPGFCVTTHAFARVAAQALSMDDLLDRLAGLDAGDPTPIPELRAELRRRREAGARPGRGAGA